MKEKYSVIVADDHPLIRMGVRAILQGTNFEIIHESEEGNDAMDKVLELCPDILITDITMPNLTGVDILTRLKETGSPVKVVVLTMHGDQEYIAGCLELGAKAYLLKESVKDDLLMALEKILKGEYYFCRYVLNMLVENVKSKRDNNTTQQAINVTLTTRESEILTMLTKGLSSKEIGEKLFISPRTVDAHKYNIMQKFNVNSSSELVYFALKNKIIG